MMRFIIMLPNSNRLKQLIHEHSNIWQALENAEPKPCFNNEPGLLIRSLDGKHERNIRIVDIKEID